LDDNSLVAKFLEGSFLFENLWDGIYLPMYEMTPLPGKKDGISSSCLGGFNIGITKYIDDDKKKAAATVLEYFMSKEVQKKLIMNFSVMSGVNIYDDEDSEEICSVINCDIAKNAQGIVKPFYEDEGFENYSNRIIRYMNSFLYNDQSAESTLEKIDDITRIYQFTFKNTSAATIIFILLCVTLAIVIISSSILFVPKYQRYFEFFGYGLGFIYTFGSVLIICSQFTYYGNFNSARCHLRIGLLLTGVTMVYAPILYRLIVNFPEINKISSWVKRNKYLFISLIIFFTIATCLISLISPFEVRKHLLQNSKNFNECHSTSLVKIISLIQIVYILLMYTLILFLIFIEWNLNKTKEDMRALSLFMGMDIVLIIVFIVLKSVPLNDYVIEGVLNGIVCLLFAVTNHTYMFIIRIIFIYLNIGKDEEEKILKRISSLKEKMAKSETTQQSETSTKTTKTTDSLPSKIISLHKQTEIQDDSETV